MKKMKLIMAALGIATVGLFSFKESKVVKNIDIKKQIVATDGSNFNVLYNVVDTGGKKKRKDTMSMPPTDTMPTKKPMDSLNNKGM